MVETAVRDFDVAVIGGGVGGATIAAILARHDVRVVIIEASSHPRFAIGESTVPDTTLGLRNLALHYDVPELANLATHGAVRRFVSPASGVKRSFVFAHHREGEPFRAEECNQFPTASPPFGPDSHFFRQDIDAYMYQVALSYGATGVAQSPVTGVDFDDDGATVHTLRDGDYRAKYVIDAGGMKSVLADQLDLRIEPPYRTRSRSIFNHFVDVEPFDKIAPPQAQHKLLSPFHQGTMHHIFDGGWAWIIAFDNHANSPSKLCSVGINLDIDKYPKLEGESPEDEFWRHVARFPDFQRQMANAKAVRPFTASSRNQFSSKQLIGDRWILLPHASDFIDPLFSSGLSVTFMAIQALGHRLIDAVRKDDYSTEQFEYIETWVKTSFDLYDRLVYNSYLAFGDFKLWNAWSRVWTLHSLYSAINQLNVTFAYKRSKDKKVFERFEQAPFRGVQSVDDPKLRELLRSFEGIMEQYRKQEIDSPEAQRLLHIELRASGLTPGNTKLLDPENRAPGGPLTIAAMGGTADWAMKKGPAHVRDNYFGNNDIRLGAIFKEAVAHYAADRRRGGVTTRRAVRDIFTSWNGDWKKSGPVK